MNLDLKGEYGMTANKRFTTVELPKPNKWGIWYDGAYLSTYQVCILLNEYVDVKKENEQLQHKLSQQEMEYATTACRQAEENQQLRKEIERKEKIIQDKSELVRQQVNVSENLQARINILERALEEEE